MRTGVASALSAWPRLVLGAKSSPVGHEGKAPEAVRHAPQPRTGSCARHTLLCARFGSRPQNSNAR
eukprot:545946-Alexandrium_andersonii.AAC.1